MSRRFLVPFFLISLLTCSCRAGDPPAAPKTASPGSSFEPPLGVSATSPTAPQKNYSKYIRFEHYNLEEGLSQSDVTVILQDHMGFLWVGTEDGLNRYDGYGFRVFKPDAADPSSLSDRWIKCLAEDPQGRLWIGTRLGGLNRYDPRTGKFTRFMHDKSNSLSLANNMVTAILPDRTGIWIGMENALDYYEYGSGVFIHYLGDPDNPIPLSSSSISTMHKDREGRLWIGTTHAGVNVFDPATNAVETYRYDENDTSSLSHNRVLSIEQDERGAIWIGTANGLNRFEAAGGYFTRFLNTREDPQLIGGNTVYEVYRDRSGSLWLGTNNGLDRFDPVTKEFIHHRHQPNVRSSLSSDIVHSIYEDRSGVIWVGTFGGGLNKYNRQQDKFAFYRNDPQDENSLSDNLVFPILVGADGYVWIGTHAAGLNRFDPKTGKFTRYLHDPENPGSLDSNDIISLSTDRTGILWIGTSRGLDRLDPKTGSFTRIQSPADSANGFSGARVFVTFEDQLGTLWIGTDRGLYMLDPSSGTITPHLSEPENPLGFHGNTVMDILEDDQGNIWVATFDDGLKRFPRWAPRILKFENDPTDPASLTSNSIQDLFRDSKGNLWVGTGGGGLNLYHPKSESFTGFTEEHGLPNNVIYGILEDRQGNLWLSTNFGLSRFDPATGTFRNFTASDGLQSNEFNQNAFAADARGALYFGGINGFNVFFPQEIVGSPLPPAVVLTSITHDGVALHQDVTAESTKEILVAWPQDSFEFEFAALAFDQPSKNRYAYMLENFDSNWIMNGTQRTGRYTNLSGGSYTLRLRAANSDGVWNETGAAIQVTVVPPFWETWWFVGLVMLAAVSSLAGGLRWRVKSIENRNRELERLVQRRTADLEKRNREIEALYQADEKILRNVTLNQVYQTLVDVSISMLNADRSAIFTVDENLQRITPRVSQGYQKETLPALALDAGKNSIERALHTGESIILQDLRLADLRSEVRAVMQAEGIQSFAHFPILVDGRAVAVFNVGYTRPNALGEDTLLLFTALVNRAVLSIANMQLFEQTRDLAVMEERNRLARDLHDSAKQKAFAALAQLGTANGMWKSKSEGIQAHLSEAETLVYEVIQELTFLIQEIYPIALQDKGLPTTLREYVFEWENRNGTLVNLVIQDERPLPLEIEQAIYRVIQESLANVSRHSRARRVNISLVYNQDSLQTMISDDGCGFDMSQKVKGLGFRSMRERIGSIHGTLQIQSAPGQGTRVIVQLPLKILAGVEQI
jgi:ligand-binding sensor domain-containing protein/signal transduction histidine kinase